MKILTKEELKKIAHLSGLQLTEEEENLFQTQLQKILNYTKEISSIAFSETLQNNKAINVFREDKVKPSEANFILKNGQAVSDEDYFIVPQILKQ